MTGRRSVSYGILDALGGLPLFLTAPLYRHWHLRWGATEDEVRGPMPGDELVPKAPLTATRAVTIGAPPSAVWPWIVQMGYRRAGFYTYDLLDNAGYESADVVLEEYQNPQVGDWMPMAEAMPAPQPGTKENLPAGWYRRSRRKFRQTAGDLATGTAMIAVGEGLSTGEPR